MDTYQDLNLTQRADDAFFDMETSPDFQDANKVCGLILDEVKKRTPRFSSYLKRHINSREQISWDEERPLEYYSDLIICEFGRRGVPASFDLNSSTPLKAAVKNWLTRRTVSRRSVFLIGFGMQMKPEEVNLLLTKGICEQEINPKDPFEVICWYCYRYEKDFSFFETLMQRYEQLPSAAPEWSTASMDATVNIRNSMYAINGPQDLFSHLSTLKTSMNIPRISRTATKCFVEMYEELAQIIAREEKIAAAEVTDEMIQDLLYEAGIGKTDQNNLLPEDASSLHDVFCTKRLSRQRIGKIRCGKEQATRYDLITMSFAICAQGEFEHNIHRYNSFLEKTNKILQMCSLQEITIQNHYEFFVLACIRTSDPMGTFWDVWERSIYADETW